MPGDRQVSLSDSSEDNTLEEQLKELLRVGRITADEKTNLLMAYHGELQSRCAQAVQNAVLGKNVELSLRERQIQKLALLLEQQAEGRKVDKLTGLLEGSYFDEFLPKLVRDLCIKRPNQDRRAGCPCLMIGDVRNLKLYNDSFGHEGGDALLAAVGETIVHNLRLGENSRVHDWASRSNKQGDEIEIFMLGARDPIDAGNAAGRIKDAFTLRADWGNPILNSLPPTVDFGAVGIKGSSFLGILEGLSVIEQEQKIADLIRQWRHHTDQLMYYAKQHALESIRFAWFEYRAGELVDVTNQMGEIRRLHVRKGVR